MVLLYMGQQYLFPGAVITHWVAQKYVMSQFWSHMSEIKLTHWKRLWWWERLKAGGEGDDRGWDGWMASPTQWTWVRVNSGSWWWTVRPGVLQSLRTSLRVQLLRICPARQWCVFFAMQEIRVQSLVRELRSHMLISSAQSLSHVWLFETPWTAARQASLSFTNSQSLLKLVSIQPSHPLLSPSPPAFNLFQHQGLFQWVSSSHQVANILEFQLQHQSFQWIFRIDLL